jgi:ribosomal protein L37AE/L43A
MEKSNIISALKERLDKLEGWKEKVAKKKEGKKEKADEEVCPICGNDLLWVEEGIVFCKKCNEYYEQIEEKE